MFIIEKVASRLITKEKNVIFYQSCVSHWVGGSEAITVVDTHCLMRINSSAVFSLIAIMLIFIEWLPYAEFGLRALHSIVSCMLSFSLFSR